MTIMNATYSPSLNQGQQDAAGEFLSFLLSDEKEFVLRGPAGTGKTFWMNHSLSAVLKDYKNVSDMLGKTPKPFKIRLTATTNKAAEVLTQVTGIGATTLDSFFGLRLKRKNGKHYRQTTRNTVEHTNTILFIDEASMLDQELYGILHRYTHSSCKIVYLGDDRQLAPVGEDISQVFINATTGAELSQPMRNAGQPALMQLCANLRESVVTGNFQQIQHTPGVIDIVDEAQAEQEINTLFQNPNVDARILAHTNQRVESYLQHIRDLRGLPPTFIKGERLINNEAKEYGANVVRAEQELEVLEELNAPSDIQVMNMASGITINAYILRISSPSNPNGASITAMIPTNFKAYRALKNKAYSMANWDAFNWLSDRFFILRGKDASTVYKAQGSTYDTVFLDVHNILKCSDDAQMARLLYVGASRARNRLIIYRG